MREAASLRGRVILTVRARRCVSCKSVPTPPRERGDIGPDVPFRHPLRRGHRRHPLSSRSSKAPGRRGSGGRLAPGRRSSSPHFRADTSKPSLAQDAGTGSKHLFPLPDGPRDWSAPRHARKGAPPRHAGLAARWAREGKGPSHVLGRSP